MRFCDDHNLCDALGGPLISSLGVMLYYVSVCLPRASDTDRPTPGSLISSGVPYQRRPNYALRRVINQR